MGGWGSQGEEHHQEPWEDKGGVPMEQLMKSLESLEIDGIFTVL